ncbi:hypothetical protein CHLNCDRAFT_140007 [Chlorella variabilis]|uniref:Phospholipase B-like n=1 Tax=Chlorella variabilis TaxID=554065 RepID=E1ZRD7_CHLVA|nr:hypothetical protein CHLNCDRAFT_140007 [Chlorella variabilis]EFN51549.1 hypothetical protein CHLNCDRAFT_140007 [Chlorella variabilis]|eukprot:XP_005843651.1 hypothetical protein CHLNCDRAFT_140007 [Chlorella variabilis]
MLLAVLAFAVTAHGLRLPHWRSTGCQNDVRAGSVRLNADGGLVFSEDPEGGLAWGSYLDSRHSPSNFGQLRVTTSGQHPDERQLQAAGFLEGYLTAQRIWDSFLNMRDYFKAGMGAEIEKPMRIEEQDRWVRGQCVSGPGQRVGAAKNERFWEAVCLLLHQFDGMKAGYRAARQAANDAAAIGDMSDWDFLFLESNGDLYDIIDWQQPDQRPSWVQGQEPPIPTVHRRSGGRHWGALEAAARLDPHAAAARLFSKIYNASGYPDFISKLEKYGQHFGLTTHWLSYQNSPRWFSEGHPICAVCGRGDLDPANPVPRGCFDTKVTSYSLAMQLQAEAVNGPTTDSWPWSVPPFRWSEAVVSNLTHRGQPERFAFRFERMDPDSPLPDQPPSCSRQQPQQQQPHAAAAAAAAGGGLQDS